MLYIYVFLIYILDSPPDLLSLLHFTFPLNSTLHFPLHVLTLIPRHTSGSLKLNFINSSGYRLNEANLPRLSQGIAVEPVIKLGAWRHLRDPNMSFIPRVSAHYNPFRKTATFRVGAFLPLSDWPCPMIQLSYETGKKDLTLSAGVKIG